MKRLLSILIFGCLAIVSVPNKSGTDKIVAKKKETRNVVVNNNVKWSKGKITTYAKYFEGRRCANGSRFSHRNSTVACRSGSFGRRIEIKYGNQTTTVILTDRGRLPLHRSNCYQYDTTKAVAKKLGLYDPKHGRTIQWRYIDSAK